MTRKHVKRARRLPQVVLTDRDREILKLVSGFGVITRPLLQIALSWSCVSDINRRLRKLVAARFLDCRPELHLPGVPPIYRLGNLGVVQLSQQLDIIADIIEHRRRHYHGLSDSLLRHELLVAEFGCRLRHALMAAPESGLIEWRQADVLPALCNPGAGIGDTVLKPDAYASFHVGQIRINGFLEADCGTESLRRISEKVAQYRIFKEDGLFAERFRAKAFRLLILTLSERRAENIRRQLKETPGVKTFITNIAAITTDLLFAPVWFLLDGSNSHQPQSLVSGIGRL